MNTETMTIEIRTDETGVPARRGSKMVPHFVEFVRDGFSIAIRTPTCACHQGETHKLVFWTLAFNDAVSDVQEILRLGIADFIYDTAQNHPIH